MSQFPQVPGHTAVQQPDGTVRYVPDQQGAVQSPYPQQQQAPQYPQQMHTQWGQGPQVAGNMPPQQHPALGGMGAGPYAFQQGQAPSPAMPQPQAMAPQGAGAFYIPSDADMARMSAEANAINERIAAARAGGGGRGSLKFLKMLGPQGQESWGPTSGVPIGHLTERIFRLLPSPNAGELHYIVADKHFWKSHQNPKGAGMWCPGKEHCLLCQAVEPALATGQGALYDQAKKWGRARAHFLYQGFAYDAIADHVGEDGLFYPMVLDAGSTLHAAIVKIIEKRGSMSILHPGYGGRPLTIGKKKTGKNLTDVEWSAIDMPEYAGPIPQEFRVGPNGEGLNLIDLKRLVKMPEVTDMQNAVIEIGLLQQTAMSYNPNPQPPNPSPYGQQMPPAGVYPGAGAPPAPQYPAQLPAAAPVGAGPQQGPPPVPQYMQNQLPAMGGVPQAPPPLPQVPQGGPSGYAPQPSQAGGYKPPLPAAPPPPPMGGVSGPVPTPQPQMPPQQQAPQQMPQQQAPQQMPQQMPQQPVGAPGMPPQAQPSQAMSELEAQLRGQAPAPTPGAPAAPPPPNMAAPPMPQQPQQPQQAPGPNGAVGAPGAPPPPNMAAPPPGQGPGF